MKSQGCALHIVSLRPFSISSVHLHSAPTHHCILVKWVGVDTISVEALCGGLPFPTPARSGPERPVNTQTNSRGVFYGIVTPSAGCWSDSGLATDSSLRQPFLVSLLPKNGRRNPFLRGPAPLPTPCARDAQGQVCFCASSAPMAQWCASPGLQLGSLGHFAHSPRKRGPFGPGSPNCFTKTNIHYFIRSHTPPKSKRLKRIQ